MHGAGVFGLIGCISLSLSLALSTSFNNNNKRNNVLKESDDLDIFGVTFDFKKRLRSVSSATYERFDILRKSWQVINYGMILERCLCGWVLLVLKYCSAVWCLAADSHLEQLERAFSQWCQILSGMCLSVTLCIVVLMQCYMYAL